MIPVSLRRCASYESDTLREALDRVVEPLGGWSAFASRGESVLVKPNFLSSRPPESAVTTHPSVILSVIDRLLDLGAKVSLGDSNAFGTVHRTIRMLGLEEEMARRGVACVDFTGQPHESVALPRAGCSVQVARHALEADRIINLPKVKVHCQMVLTLGVKNLFGAIPSRKKAMLHMKLGKRPEHFSAMLLDLADRLAPSLSLADGVVMMDRHGPMRGTPRTLGVLAASADPVALDAALTELLGVPGSEVYILAEARRQERPGAFLANLTMLGDPLDELRIRDVTLPDMLPIRFSIPHMIRAQLRDWKRKLLPVR